MVHLHDLDIEDLAKILDYVITPKYSSPSQWISNLRFLHVCSLWTSIAEPLVLCDVFIQLDVPISDVRGGHQIETPNILCYTNAWIIIDRGGTVFAESVYITSLYLMSYRDYFETALVALRSDAIEWNHVKRLLIDMTASYTSYFTERTADISVDILGGEVASRIRRCMPFITHLKILESSPSKSEVANPLVQEYIQQLIFLISAGPINFGVNRFSYDLTVLQISLNPESKPLYLPQLAAAPLIELSLKEIPVNFTWDEFYDASNLNITFHCLKILTLKFIQSPLPANRAPRAIYNRLHFPQIHSLTIENLPSETELLHCQPYFASLKYFEISGNADSIALAMDMGLITNDEIRVDIKDLETHDQLGFIAANYLFNTVNANERAQLSISVPINALNVEYLNWRTLTNLYILAPINVNVFVRLATRTPRLSMVSAPRLTFDLASNSDISNDGIIKDLLSISDSLSSSENNCNSNAVKPPSGKSQHIVYPNTFSLLKPITSSRITTAFLFFDADIDDAVELKAALVGYILMRLPSIRLIYTNSILKPFLDRITQILFNEYRHLNIVYH